MMGSQGGAQERLFYSFSLEDHVPRDHLLRGIDRFLDLGDLRQHLSGFYSHTGRPSIDPQRRGRKVNVRVDGPLIFNTSPPQVDAALAGLGLALSPEDELMAHIVAGPLVRVLEDWCPKFAGYHLYYPSRRQPSPAFSLVVEALRFRG